MSKLNKLYLGNNEESFSECLYSELSFTWYGFAVFSQVNVASHFERSCSGNNCFIIVDVLDSSESISDSVFNHSNSMFIGTFDQNSARFGVFNSSNEGVFIFTQNMFLNSISIAKISFSELLHWVDSWSSASQYNSFHISSLSTSESNDTCFGKQFKADRINTFLINNNKRFIVSFCNFVFEFDDFSATLVSKSSFGFGHFVSVSGIGEEKLGVDFSLFVFEWNIAS